MYIDWDERESAKKAGAFWDGDAKEWVFWTSRSDADLPPFIAERRSPPAVVKVKTASWRRHSR